MSDTASAFGPRAWLGGLKPYGEKAPIAAFFLGVSSGFPYAMIGATLNQIFSPATTSEST